MRKEKIVFIGSHPDDIDLGCAVSLHDNYLKGNEITSIILTEGEKGGLSSERIIEQNSSLNILAPGSQNVFLKFPDTQLYFYTDEIINKIKSVVLSNLPDMVYIPSQHDFHQDHVVTNQCAMAAFNYLKVNKIICYETPSTMPRFSPNYFKLCNIVQFQIKLDALRCHTSQNGKAYFSEEIVYSIARMRAAQCRYHDGLAEAYEIVRFTEFY